MVVNKNAWDFDKILKLTRIIYLLITLAFFLGIFMWIASVEAKDLGVYGKTYNIKEADIEEEMKRKLTIYEENGELEKFQKKYQKEVTRQIKNPNRVIGISNATENKLRIYNPSVYLEEDIQVPKGGIEQAKANPEAIEYEVLHKAGTEINPLKYMDFTEPLIFIDGKNEAQLEYARRYQDNNLATKIILIDGNPGYKEVEGKEYYYYFDQWGAYSEKFQISKVPSIVYQKKGDLVLTIEEIAVEKENEGK